VATYATIDNLREASRLVTGYDDASLEAELTSAELDIDNYVPPASLLANGLKMDPTQLPADRLLKLQLATCFQAEYRLHMGPTFFIEGSTTIKGSDHEESGAPKIAPKAKQELLAGGFVSLTGRAV